MKSIKLVYWTDVCNLGDMLSPYIINKLSGLPVKHKNRFDSLGKKGQLISILKYLSGRMPKSELSDILFAYERNFLGIGSILSWGNRRSVVWGSGFMNQSDKFRGGKVYAVRGRLSNEKLQKDGFAGCSVFGDPALLLPLFVEPSAVKKYDVVILPHWSEFDALYEKYGEKYKVLDIRTNDVEMFVRELTSSCYVLSSSLHGIIISHAYNIPALWIRHGNIGTDGFKFHDYFSSVEIPFYDGIIDFESYLAENNLGGMFDDYDLYSLPHKEISSIQKELIRVAPFKVLEKYIGENH